MRSIQTLFVTNRVEEANTGVSSNFFPRNAILSKLYVSLFIFFFFYYLQLKTVTKMLYPEQAATFVLTACGFLLVASFY